MPKKSKTDTNGLVRMLAAANLRIEIMSACLREILHEVGCPCTRCAMIRKAMEHKS